MTVSYAQQFEDVILWRALKHIKKGTYIDIGANDPEIDSVSRLFYEQGWRGLSVEPMPDCAKRLRDARPDEDVLEAAVGEGKDNVTLFSFEGTGLTTAIADHAHKHQEVGHTSTLITVPCLTLCDVFDQFNRRNIHWLKIDVEGMEQSVLTSWGDHPARPWIVVVESTLPNSQELSYKEWEDLLVSRGYKFVYFDGLNRFYLHQDHADLKPHFGTPPNFFDRFFLSEHSPFSGFVTEKWHSAREEARQLMAEASSLIDDRDKFHSQLVETLATLQQAQTEHQKQMRELQEQLRTEAASAHALNQLSDARLSEINHLSTELDHLQKHYAATDAERNHLKAHVAAIEARLAENAQFLRQTHEIAASVQAALETSESIRTQLLAEKEETTSAHKAAEEAFRREITLYEAELASLREQVEAAAQRDAEKEAGLRQDIAALEAELASLREQAEAAAQRGAEKEAVLRQDIASLEAELASMREQAEAASALEASLRQELEDAIHSGQETLAQLSEQHGIEIAALDRQLSDLQTQVSDRDHNLVLAHEHIRELAGQTMMLQQELDHWRTEVFAYRDQTTEVFSSASWKLSAPVRWAGGALRAGARLTKHLLRPVAGGLLRLARVHPWVKRPILATANLAPPLRRKIDHFATIRAPERPMNGIAREETWRIMPDPAQIREWDALLSQDKSHRRANR